MKIAAETHRARSAGDGRRERGAPGPCNDERGITERNTRQRSIDRTGKQLCEISSGSIVSAKPDEQCSKEHPQSTGAK